LHLLLIVAERLKSARSANHILPVGQKKERGERLVACSKRLSEETHGVSIHQSIAPQCDCFDTGLLVLSSVKLKWLNPSITPICP